MAYYQFASTIEMKYWASACRLISIRTLVEVSFARVSASFAIAAQAHNQNQQKQCSPARYACSHEIATKKKSVFQLN